MTTPFRRCLLQRKEALWRPRHVLRSTALRFPSRAFAQELITMKASFLAAAFLAATLTPVHADEVEVKMLTRGAAGMMVFEPARVQIAPGDSVRFVPVDTGHNAQSIDGMIPEDADPFKGGIGKELVVTFDQEGIYGYQCMPHYGMGMVGLVVVGNKEANIAAAQALKQRGKAAKRFDSLFADLNS